MVKEVKLVTDPEEIEEVYAFIKKHPYDYPDYLLWVEKCFGELKTGNKKAVVFKSDGKIIGSLVFQKHKEEPGILEMKNGRVETDYQKEKVFTRVYKKVECYAKENNFKRIIADTHAENTTVIEVLKKLGFRIESCEQLYDQKLEAILEKDID